MAEEKVNTKPRGRTIEVTGTVVSDRMSKTIGVKVDRLVQHSKYKKYYKRSSVFKAHDEENQAKLGDKVLIKETKPISKTKRWRLAKIVEASKIRE